GSAGGHNGLTDVLAAMGTEQVPRLRIGIGQPPEEMDPADFVLSRFGKDEEETIAHAVQLAADAVEGWLYKGIEYVMEMYNRKADG
ncbi:MAG: aminoacyl-tRNA hydrolase, partial [Phycisphaerae bacterium]|nr:aminoacyl-tRNA hydrolase [Phycisphaerae bacterium]